MQRTTPRLFDAATAEELILNKGNRIQDLRFSADGRALRTVDADGIVCFWDVTNLAFLRKVSIPAGYVVGSIRPSDGRYALCSDGLIRHCTCKLLTWIPASRSARQACLSPGKTWASSPSAHARNVHWLSDPEVVYTGRFLYRHSGVSEDWWRLNYQTGEVIDYGDPRSIPLRGVRHDLESKIGGFGSDGEVTEDGKHLFVIGGGGKGSPPDVARTNRLRDLSNNRSR